MSRDLHWSNDDTFTLDDTAFRLAPLGPAPSSSDRFILAKPAWMVEQYLELAPEFVGGRVVELGISQGGSAAFFAHLLQPSAFLALDILERPVAALAEFVEARGYVDTVHLAYGVDQGDRPRLEELVHSHLGPEPLDLVIDDASHVLQPSLTSFAVLFPRLRPGGVLVLEDWSQAQTWERAMRDERQPAEMIAEHIGKPRAESDLSSLVVQLTLVAAYAPEVVAELDVRAGFAIVRRGGATLDPDAFDLSSCYGDVARAILAADD